MLARMQRNSISHTLLVGCKVAQPFSENAKLLFYSLLASLKTIQTCYQTIQQWHLSQRHKILGPHKNLYMTAALFVIAQNRETTKTKQCPSMNEWLIKL